MADLDILEGLFEVGARYVSVNTYHLRNIVEAPHLPLWPLFSAIDDKHRYKAPHANRPGARPYERKRR